MMSCVDACLLEKRMAALKVQCDEAHDVGMSCMQDFNGDRAAPQRDFAKGTVMQHVTILREAAELLFWPKVDDDLQDLLTAVGVRVIAPF